MYVIYTLVPFSSQALLEELKQILVNLLFLGGHLKNKAAEKAS